MTWFRADDDFYDHPKVMRIPVRYRNEACGVWLRAGTWAARYSTDGFLPTDIVRSFDPRERTAARLVEVGLWAEDKRDGQTGYSFHQWLERQPSVAETTSRKQRNAERQRRFRERRNGVDPVPEPPDGCDEPIDDQHEYDIDDIDYEPTFESSNGTRNALRNGATNATPSRPVPLSTSSGAVRSDSSSSVGRQTSPARKRASPRGTRIPDDFAVTEAMVKWAREHAPHVDGRFETDQFRDYWSARAGREAVKVDWVATWRNWMRRTEQRSGRQPTNHREQPGQLNPADQRLADVQALKARFRGDNPPALRAIGGTA